MTNVILHTFERSGNSELFALALSGSPQSLFEDQDWELDVLPVALRRNGTLIWGFEPTSEERMVWSKMGRGDFFLFKDQEGIYCWGRIQNKYVANSVFSIQKRSKKWSRFISFKKLTPLQSAISPTRVQNLLGISILEGTSVRSLTEVGVRIDEFLELLLRDSERTRPSQAEELESRRSHQDPSLLLPGQTFKNRTEIWKLFGGQKIWGINKFAGDEAVNVFSKEDGPYPDYENPETGVIEYCGQGLKGDQSLTLGNMYLEEARLHRQPVRYWRRPRLGVWRFEKWVKVVDYEYINEPDAAGEPVKKLLWYLEPVSILNPTQSEESQQPVDVVPQTKEENTDSFNTKDFSERYLLLSQKANESRTQDAKTLPTLRSSYRRSRALRKLVLERAEGVCEYDKCTGMPPDNKANGEAILEVDHINPLAQQGSDHPSNMVSLCPNCHTAKTFGLRKGEMISRLKFIVSQKEKNFLNLPPETNS